jgi:chemotaxis regulatin CheY-phosphate phosphatase CheZ
MELILGKLRHDAKSITTEDARSLADNTEDGDEQTADIIAAVTDIAARNEAERNTINDDHPRSSDHTSQSAFSVSEDVIERLRNDPSSITEEDARRFSENVEATNPTSARLVSAVESLAAAHNEIYSKNINLGQSPHPSLLTVVKDLYAAVEANPEDINTEILKTTQSIVNSE